MDPMKSASLPALTGIECRMARAAFGWTMRELAHAAGVSRFTVIRLEAGTAIGESSAVKLRKAFEVAGAQFAMTSEGGGRVAVSVAVGGLAKPFKVQNLASDTERAPAPKGRAGKQ